MFVLCFPFFFPPCCVLHFPFFSLFIGTRGLLPMYPPPPPSVACTSRVYLADLHWQTEIGFQHFLKPDSLGESIFINISKYVFCSYILSDSLSIWIFFSLKFFAWTFSQVKTPSPTHTQRDTPRHTPTPGHPHNTHTYTIVQQDHPIADKGSVLTSSLWNVADFHGLHPSARVDVHAPRLDHPANATSVKAYAGPDPSPPGLFPALLFSFFELRDTRPPRDWLPLHFGLSGILRWGVLTVTASGSTCGASHDK